MITGRGIWIWQIANCDGGNWDKIIARCKASGIEWIVVKCGDAGRNAQWNKAAAASAIKKCHDAGLKIGGWNYSKPNTWQSEVNLITECSKEGLDLWIVDPEIEYEKEPNNKVIATQFMQALRANLGNDFILGYAPFAIPQYHTPYPYKEFHKYSSFVAGQLYWCEFSWPISKAISLHDQGWAAFNKANPDIVIPVAPIGNTYGKGYPGVQGTLTAEDLKTFLDHYKDVPLSLYSYDAAKGFPTWDVLENAPVPVSVSSEPLPIVQPDPVEVVPVQDPIPEAPRLEATGTVNASVTQTATDFIKKILRLVFHI